MQVPPSTTTSQGTTAAERTKQSHHEKPQSAAVHPTRGADCSPLFVRTYKSLPFRVAYNVVHVFY